MKPDYRKRLANLRQAIRKKGLDGAFITSLNDIYYYTGKAVTKGDPGFLLVTRKSSTLFVSTLDNALAGPGVQVLDDFRVMKKQVKAAGKLGIDERNMNVLLFKKLGPGKLKPFGQELKAQRMVKDSYEISELTNVAKKTVRILKSLKPKGRSELEVLADIHARIRKLGLEPSFDPIVASGSNSHKVHFSPGNARIGKGLVIIDMGMRRNKYCSDLTRMYPSGLTAKQDSMLDSYKSLCEELISMATPGTKFADMQKVYASTLKKQGLKVMQSFGHGIGLGVHERPSRGDVLEKRMVITVEPGLYKKGIGGCRIEDMILVSNNKPRILSK